MRPLLKFMSLASPDEQKELADAAGTSVSYLQHLARAYSRRCPSVSLAVAIERATRHMHKYNRRLPVVTCVDLADES